MAALTKAVYDSALTEDDEPAEPSVARLLPGGTTVAALIVVVVLIAAVGCGGTRRHASIPRPSPNPPPSEKKARPRQSRQARPHPQAHQQGSAPTM